MLNTQSNTQEGRKVFPSPTSLAGLEGLLVKIVNVAGVANLQLPATRTDLCPFVIHDGGFNPNAGAYAAAVWPLTAERNYRVSLNGTCNPGDTLVLADPTPNSGAQAGMVNVLPSPGSGLVLGAPAVAAGKITGQPITSGGTGYTQGQPVAWTDSTGYGAIGFLNVTAGVVTGITLTDGGAGYTAPTPVVANPGILYRSVGIAEEAGLSGQLVLLRPCGGLLTV